MLGAGLWRRQPLMTRSECGNRWTNRRRLKETLGEEKLRSWGTGIGELSQKAFSITKDNNGSSSREEKRQLAAETVKE